MARSESSSLHDGDGQAGAVLLTRVLGHDLGSYAITPHQLSLQAQNASADNVMLSHKKLTRRFSLLSSFGVMNDYVKLHTFA